VKALTKPFEKLITTSLLHISRMGLEKLNPVSVPLLKEWLLKNMGWNR